MYSLCTGRSGLDTCYCVSQRLAPAWSRMSVCLFLCSWLWLLNNYWSKQGQGASGWGSTRGACSLRGFCTCVIHVMRRDSLVGSGSRFKNKTKTNFFSFLFFLFFLLGQLKLQALVYDILPSTTAVFSYAIGSRKLSANEQFFVSPQTVVSLLQTNQIKQGVSFIAANKVYTSANKTTIV